MTAKKFDLGKPPISLINRAALEEEARVLDYGAQKYGRDNWRNGMDHSRLLDAAFRHLIAYVDGESIDPESGLCHLAHARCSLGFLIHYRRHGVGVDDRVSDGTISMDLLKSLISANEHREKQEEKEKKKKPAAGKYPGPRKSGLARQAKTDAKYKAFFAGQTRTTPEIASAFGYSLSGTISSLMHLEARGKVERVGVGQRPIGAKYGRPPVIWRWKE